MNSRVDKYYDEKEIVSSRTSRNKELYKEINKTELENFEVRSNATIIGDNRKNIDVEKIKSILDTHYNDIPKRRTIKIDHEEEEQKSTPIFETKEYDINIIIDKAKESKEETYEESRVKKLRDTQYDILNNLDFKVDEDAEDKKNIEHHEDDDSIDDTTSKELEKLIKTITINEKSLQDTDTNPLEIFEDLKGSENTIILDGIKEKVKEADDSNTKTSSLDDSFFTKSNSFKQKDFDDFKEIEGSKSGVFIKILIILLILAFITGIIILVNTIM